MNLVEPETSSGERVFEYFFYASDDHRYPWTTMLSKDPRDDLVAVFVSMDSNSFPLLNGRVEDIRRVLDGEADVWEGTGESTHWSIRQDVTVISCAPDDGPADEAAPPVRIRTSTLEELILLWDREKKAHDTAHPGPLRESWHRAWRNRRALHGGQGGSTTVLASHRQVQCDNEFEYFFYVSRSVEKPCLVMSFMDSRMENLSIFIDGDSRHNDLVDGRLEPFRRVLDGEIDVWESGGNSTCWTIRRDLTEVASEFEIYADESFDPGPRVLIPTRLLEQLILIWRREEAMFDRLHPSPQHRPGPPSRFQRWWNRITTRRERRTSR